MDEARIADFWNTHPCGEALGGGLGDDYDRFFREYDRQKYALESHIPACLDEVGFNGRDVLEVGLGQGSESEQIIRRGGRWHGLELTPESVDRVRTRLALRGLDGDVRQGSVLDIPFPDSSFDVVFSHGVLHHVPDIHRAQREIHRVLRPGGFLVVMLYARHSLNYKVSIPVVRRLLLLGAYPLARAGLLKPSGVLAGHVRNAREMGLLRYLRMENFVHRNTDGPDNPFSRVYDGADVLRDFPDFQPAQLFQRFMHAPPLPVHRLPGESRWGWHLWAVLLPAKLPQVDVARLRW